MDGPHGRDRGMNLIRGGAAQDGKTEQLLPHIRLQATVHEDAERARDGLLARYDRSFTVMLGHRREAGGKMIAAGHQYPPLSERRDPGPAPASGWSVIMQSMVSNRPAIEAAFCSARRVTLAGSTTPAFTRSSYSPVATL